MPRLPRTVTERRPADGFGPDPGWTPGEARDARLQERELADARRDAWRVYRRFCLASILGSARRMPLRKALVLARRLFDASYGAGFNDRRRIEYAKLCERAAPRRTTVCPRCPHPTHGGHTSMGMVRRKCGVGGCLCTYAELPIF